jgi:alkanesulfonate monooxygenase SsuD/methylene tetrahydromethanopterin reductase-like flavin-dependent oxidoreductase (luciferase family)
MPQLSHIGPAIVPVDKTRNVDLTLWPSVSKGWASLLDVVTHVDRAGWYGVVVEDHFMADGAGFGAVDEPRLEATSLLAALAVATSSLRLAPLVLSATYRHPAVVANWAATLDHLSQGRMRLGLGAGWQVNEHSQYGIDLGTPAERLGRLDEYCVIVRSLLDQPVTDVAGRWFTVCEARCEPKPLQRRLPLLIGGKGDRMLGLVTRRADEWNMWALPDLFAERSARLDRDCEAIGRDPSTIRRSTQALVLVTEDRTRADAFVRAAGGRAAFAGSTDAFAELVAAWRAAGVDEVIVPDWHLGEGSERADALDALAAAVDLIDS